MTTPEIEKNYNPSNIEDKWYQTWLEHKMFKPNEHQKESFSIIMPPPNVTGKLHLGHALDNTCQDILIRFKRMKGFKSLWIPGTDHAGIATQAVVEKTIYKEEGKTKHDLGREEFLNRIWQWKEENGTAIINQLKKLGVSCDWDYFCFTMDETPNKAVRKVFTELFNQGLIYRAERIINWDVNLQSAISDAEVEYKEVQGHFYHIKYQVKNSDQFLEIATTRPETLFGDTAIAVHPDDSRYKDLIGRSVIIPICQREIPIVADEHVDLEVGTACLKVTPGHDFNDFEIGKRHDLPIINILNKDGTFNQQAEAISGLDVKNGRKKTIELLKEMDALITVREHSHQVAHGERSDSIIEPMVSQQWFLNTHEMAKQAVESVESERMNFIPKMWENTFFSWMKNPKDWCLSRQLWWGHQIPVFYCQDCDHHWASETDPKNCSKCQSKNIEQDPDVLDTWFSSGLWPLSTLGWPDEDLMQEKKFNDFFPNSVLVTGFDIIFFWVARMSMMSETFMKKAPFSDVYIHGIVRDKFGRKMSKSLGNGIDPIEVIDQYGADALRFTLATGCGHNQSFNLDTEQIVGSRNFINKIWNAFRFVQPHLEHATDFNIKDIEQYDIHEKWILSELNQLIKDVTHNIEQYRFDETSHLIYAFVYDKFCSWFIEFSKSILYSDDTNKKQQRVNILKYCFENILKLIHPITPFVTEEIYAFLNEGHYVINQKYPEYREDLNFEDIRFLMTEFIQVVTSIRNLRSSVQLKPKDEIECHFYTHEKDFAQFLYDQRHELKHLAKVVAGTIKDKSKDRPGKSVMGATSLAEIFLPVEGLIDINQEISRLEKQMGKLTNEWQKSQKKLDNPKFVSNAPEDVIDEVKVKATQLHTKIESIKKNLAGLR